jgi:hypothetical protein
MTPKERENSVVERLDKVQVRRLSLSLKLAEMAPRSFQRGYISKEECVKKAPQSKRGFLLFAEARAGAGRRHGRPARRRVGAEGIS